ncbi:hypothetical protein H6G95_32825 [Nostoc linckia FACHB-391]|uniref:Uncharacterized protein n=1 Tax=Nostoc linckia FACHB-391 TaxID=2692906 RepID=A0ABR8F5K7_NOSLI|nr:hypothetical protein [Nostoc linckia FACHB-391]
MFHVSCFRRVSVAFHGCCEAETLMQPLKLFHQTFCETLLSILALNSLSLCQHRVKAKSDFLSVAFL